jgi:hypothetical protein
MIGVIRPGDTVVIATSKLMNDADAVKYQKGIEASLPGIKVHVIASVTEMVIYRDGSPETGAYSRETSSRDAGS